jgi:hypothetical protein
MKFHVTRTARGKIIPINTVLAVSTILIIAMIIQKNRTERSPEGESRSRGETSLEGKAISYVVTTTWHPLDGPREPSGNGAGARALGALVVGPKHQRALVLALLGAA